MGGVLDFDAPEGVDERAWSAAIAAIRAYCGWHIAPVFSHPIRARVNGNVIVLPSLRVVTAANVTVSGSALAEEDWVLMPDAPTLHLRRVVRHDSCLPTVASLDLTHGFDYLPEDLLAVAHEAATRGVAGSFVSQVGQVKYAGSDALPGSASFMLGQRSVMDRYRLAPRP